eukprot:3224844-Rhodomonas_salina.2
MHEDWCFSSLMSPMSPMQQVYPYLRTFADVSPPNVRLLRSTISLLTSPILPRRRSQWNSSSLPRCAGESALRYFPTRALHDARYSTSFSDLLSCAPRLQPTMRRPPFA